MSAPSVAENRDALVADIIAAQGGDTIYDEIEIEDMEYDEEKETYYYACPCGDRFFITEDDLLSGQDIAHCPSCSLRIRVIYDPEDFEDEDDDDDGHDNDE